VILRLACERDLTRWSRGETSGPQPRRDQVLHAFVDPFHRDTHGSESLHIELIPSLAVCMDDSVAQMCDEAGVPDLEWFKRDVPDTFEQPLPGAKQYRRHVQPQLVEEPRR
jgi:hypothetical protein